ncbi:MAG: polysaccharide pyruvyl transferase CsaB [Oscillospiraceae bacterium]|nr:polysaccharide pyruvyl transferase CsaB [Oscillospiraceae bacterium]
MYKPYKILMLATSMEYGGGETHILELSKYLKSNGTDIKIISNQSELFEKEIKAAEIEYIYAPFHSRSIFDMRKSGKILKDIIKSYKPDVVHAHSRIPAFVAAKICKKFKIPLVTTMHGTFKQSFLLKLATKWGDYSLYVSDDIKKYWQKYYKLKNGYMIKTVNGINTDLFNAKNNSVGTPYMASGNGHDIKQEYNIKPEEKIILSVSRLENRSGFNLAYSAVKLCEIAEDIYNHDKNTRIIIVGDGEIYSDIKNTAEKINAKIGFEYIIMTGRRPDAYNFCKACDVSVGISRFALEALACAKPVIMCGDMGYLGRFTKENSDKCENTNFTCRGFDYPDNINNILLNEILFCLDENNKDIVKADANFGLNLICGKYSVKKMADDAYFVYQKAVLKYKNYDFVLSGYYGYNNIGDDTLLFTVISNITQKKHDIKICLLTKNTKKTQEWLDNYFSNITVKHRFNFLSVRKAIKKSKALVFGGGTLLCDNTSTRSFIYYSYLLKTAQKLGKKTVLYANGIGPFQSKKNKQMTEELIQNITLATIRDEESFNYINGMNLLSSEKEKIYPTADEALTVRQNNYLDAYKKDFKEYIKGDYIAISVRKWKYVDSTFFAKFAAAIDIICRENNLIPVYLVMHPDNDEKISDYLTQLNARAYCANVNGDIEKALAIIRSAQAVISMRLHTLIFAAAFGVPMIGISYDPKVKSFLHDIFIHDAYTAGLQNFSKEVLTEKFNMLMSNKDTVIDQINGATEKLYKKAEKNAGLFLKAMEFEHE